MDRILDNHSQPVRDEPTKRRRIVNEKQFNPRFFKRLKVAVEDVDGQFAVAVTYPDCLTHKQAKVLRDHLEDHFHDSLQRITVAGK